MTDVEFQAVDPVEAETVRNIDKFALTRAALIAALMEDSIGYLVPVSADLHIKEWERGETTCFCERCVYVFNGDLRQCVEHAARRWLEDLPEDRRQPLLERVEQISKLDEVSQTTAGLLWPTLG
jgi:hypothetical protein